MMRPKEIVPLQIDRAIGVQRNVFMPRGQSRRQITVVPRQSFRYSRFQQDGHMTIANPIERRVLVLWRLHCVLSRTWAPDPGSCERCRSEDR
jgi:hypothetical protein